MEGCFFIGGWCWPAILASLANLKNRSYNLFSARKLGISLLNFYFRSQKFTFARNLQKSLLSLFRCKEYVIHS